MSHRGGGGDPGPIPGRWLNCPRKSDDLIGGKFLALKTPLDDRYDAQVPPQTLFHPTMVFAAMRSYKVKIGLWIDLTNTSRYAHSHRLPFQWHIATICYIQIL